MQSKQKRVKLMHRFAHILQKIGLKRLALSALLIRFLLGIPFGSGDLENYAIWGTYAREFGFSGFYDFLNFGNYARPDYPPLAIVMFWAIKHIWGFLFAILWNINVAVPAFPSGFVTWFDHSGYLFLIKLPGLLADFGVGFLFYYYLKQKTRITTALLAASLHWFNPATVYVSSMWGQVDGVIIFLAFLSFVCLEKKQVAIGLLLFTISILVKPTMLMIAPVLLYVILRGRLVISQVVKAILISSGFAIGIVYLFAPWNPVVWLVQKYLFYFIPAGARVLPYIQVRAFNFWTLITGNEFTSSSVMWAGFTLSEWAFLLSILSFLAVAFIMMRTKNDWLSASLFILAAFLFLPGVHERYLQPLIAFSLPFFVRSTQGVLVWIVVVLLHFFNLYAAWQVPHTIISSFLNIDVVARVLSLVLLILFFYLIRYYRIILSRNEQTL